MNRNFEAVYGRMKEMCDRTGLEPRDLVVEVNFMPNDEDGVIPSFATPPAFNVVSIHDYLSGEAAPTWKDVEKFKDFAEGELSAKAEISRSGLLLVGHAHQTWCDSDILELYRKPGTAEKLRMI